VIPSSGWKGSKQADFAASQLRQLPNVLHSFALPHRQGHKNVADANVPDTSGDI
jgi:hypothetical protein